MKTDRPLLTIAIPTYNRSECLAQLFETLAPQLACESRVELIISDNASSDDTAALVKSFSDSGLVLTYSRNPTNIGADANFLRCYEMAKGEYVWIFGDDDVIVPGGLHEVLLHLETQRYDLLHINATGFRGQYETSVTPKLSHKIQVFASARDFALQVFAGLTFISGNITRKATLEQFPQGDFRKLVGTNLEQLSWTFALLRSNPLCACLLDNLVASRVENSGGHGTCQVFGTNLHAIVKEYFGLQSHLGRAILNRTIQSWFPWAMLERRRSHESNHLPEDPVAILGPLYRDNPRYWLFLYPVLRLPLPLAEVWLVAVKAINRLDQLLGYPISR